MSMIETVSVAREAREERDHRSAVDLFATIIQCFRDAGFFVNCEGSQWCLIGGSEHMAELYIDKRHAICCDLWEGADSPCPVVTVAEAVEDIDYIFEFILTGTFTGRVASPRAALGYARGVTDGLRTCEAVAAEYRADHGGGGDFCAGIARVASRIAALIGEPTAEVVDG